MNLQLNYSTILYLLYSYLMKFFWMENLFIPNRIGLNFYKIYIICNVGKVPSSLVNIIGYDQGCPQFSLKKLI